VHPPAHCPPPKWERWAVLLLLTAFFGFNLATCIDYPEVWCDEIWFSEPAVNFVKYGSFATMVYQFQPVDTFPTVNCPLYLLSLVPWLSIFGTTILAIRSFNYFLMAFAASLAWAAACRLGLIRKPTLRLLMLALLHLGYGMSFAYRCSRPDILGMVALLFLLLSFTIERRLFRELCVAFFSALTVWIGLQVSLFACLAGAGAWLIFRRPSIRELVIISASIGVSASMMLLFFKAQGVLPNFLLLTLGILGKHYAHAHVPLVWKITKVLYNTAISWIDDFTVTVLTLGLVLLVSLAWKRLDAFTRRVLSLCAILMFATPVVFNVVGHYAFYYAYVRFVPAALAFFALWSSLSERPSMAGGFFTPRRISLVGASTLGFAAAVGLPMRLLLTVMTARVMPRHEIESVIASSVRPDDVVLCDYAYFFETKRTTPRVYDRLCSPVLTELIIPGRDLTDEQKRSINVLIIRPNEQKLIMDFAGGHWIPQSAPFGDTFDPGRLGRLPAVGKRFEHYLNQRQTERYQLQIFRRAGEQDIPPR
jgi:hypothetical protein